MLQRRFVHVLLTRFNVKIAGGKGKDRDWLEHRFECFERFCLPSVEAQSCQNFHWLVFFDSSLSPSLRARVAAYACKRLIPVYVPEFFRQSTAMRAIAPLVQAHEFLITTRLDNDDALATDFVETVQSRFTGQTLEFINLRHGFVIGGTSVCAWSHPCNPFISLIERAEGFRTVLCGCHNDLWQLGPVQQVEELPGWLQVVHGRNIANGRKGIPVSAAEWAPHFSIYPQCLKR